MKFKSHLASIMGVFAFLCSANIAKAESDVVISVDEGVSMAQPIAVIPCKGSANEDIGQIIADDLRNSGKFRKKIAYVVQRGVSSYELRVSDYDGFNAFSVVKSKEPLMSPEWAPDGGKLAYVTFENKKAQVVVHDLRSGSRRVVAALKGHNGAPAFSPDGSKIAFASNQDGELNIYVVGANGGTPSKLTANAGNNTEPSWSPDGSSIYFTSDRSGSPQVYRMSASGGGVSNVGGGVSYAAKSSADGKNLIMIAGDKVVKRDLTSGGTEVLSSTFLDESPSISPNGIMVIYSSTKGTSKVLQLVSADGRFKANLPGAGGQYKFPAWSPYLTKQ